MSLTVAGLAVAFVLSAAMPALAHQPGRDARLPTIGPAPPFALRAADGARGTGWAFLTGTPAEIKDVTQRYGVFARKTDRGDVDHTFLTSLVDRDGALRVQYMGVRFDPDEMLRDLRALVREGGR